MKWMWAVILMLGMKGFSAEESFVVANGRTGEKIAEIGPHVTERVSPCSTFKIALSLMGFDRGVLKSSRCPEWDYRVGYDDFLPVWKLPQTPQSWMKYSCIWYSKVLVTRLGLETVQDYLDRLDYGNRDMSGGLTKAWVASSLEISPAEQVRFLQRMLNGQLSVTTKAVQMTRGILLLQELEDWKLFGKTGWTGSRGKQDEIGWFVGWVEKDRQLYPFAYQVRAQKIDLDQRIPRTIELLRQCI